MKLFKRPATYIVVATCIAILFAIGYTNADAIEDMSGDAYTSLKLFSQALARIESTYVEKVEMKKLVYGAINGMLQSLDPHSSFLDPDFFNNLAVETTGSFGGLGIEISTRKGYIAVIAPIDDTPAAKAGIKPNDLIVKIEGKSTKGMTLMEAVKLLRGEPGSYVKISIWRKGMVTPKQVTITRAIIKVKAVKDDILEPGYGYVKITSFNAQASKSLEKSLKKLEAQEGGMKGLVLDLRNNPGGLLDQAAKVTDKFIKSGLIVYTQGRIQTQDIRLGASKPGTHPDFPMVVLINGGSASASEIVAGALQDHKRAVIVGEQSYGKGSVQTIIRLEDGSGLRLTTAKYYTPSGREVQAKGIIPDFEVPGTIWDGMDQEHANFFRERDLQNRLQNDNEESNESEEPDVPELPEDNGSDEKDEEGLKKEKEEHDYQLESALSILKSWDVFKNVGHK